MDVFFEPQKGRPFAIEVGFFDTVLEIKEKIQKFQGIPIPKQTLIFKNQPLRDDEDVGSCEILHNSRISLLLDSGDDLPLKTDNPCFSEKIKLSVKIPSSATRLDVEMQPDDRVQALKEKIHDSEALPVSRLVLCFSGTELLNNRYLRDYELGDNSEIEVSFRSSPRAVAVLSGPKKLKVTVKPPREGTEIQVEVIASDNVGELRNELEKLHKRNQFQLPEQDYFFIHKQIVMEDDRSFRCHCVGQGDTIELRSSTAPSVVDPEP